MILTSESPKLSGWANHEPESPRSPVGPLLSRMNNQFRYRGDSKCRTKIPAWIVEMVQGCLHANT